jgi:hypothetical protein
VRCATLGWVVQRLRRKESHAGAGEIDEAELQRALLLLRS